MFTEGNPWTLFGHWKLLHKPALDKYTIGKTLITLLTLAIITESGGEFSSLTEAIAVTLLCSGLLEA